MAYFKFFDTWDLNADRWVVYGGSATSTAGTLTADTSVAGPVTLQPSFPHGGYEQRQSAFMVYKHDVTITGRMKFGFSTSMYQPSPVVAGIEAFNDGVRTWFVAHPDAITGFDGNGSIPGNTFQLRIAFTLANRPDYYWLDLESTNFMFRAVICDTNGVPVVGLDTGWLDATWLTLCPTGVSGWSTLADSTDRHLSARPFYSIMSGTAVFGPQTGYSGAEQADAISFLENGDLPYSTVATPVITVTPVTGNASTISISSEAGSQIWLTLNDAANKEGPFGSKNRFAYSGPFQVQGPTCIRAAATKPNCLESAVAKAWANTAGALASPPEIAPPSCAFDLVGAPIEVRIGHENPNASIRYTTDGSIPTLASPLYTGSFNVRSTTKVRATAFVDSQQSPLVSSVYTEGPAITTVDLTSLDAFVTNGNASVVTGSGASSGERDPSLVGSGVSNVPGNLYAFAGNNGTLYDPAAVYASGTVVKMRINNVQADVLFQIMMGGSSPIVGMYYSSGGGVSSIMFDVYVSPISNIYGTTNLGFAQGVPPNIDLTLVFSGTDCRVVVGNADTGVVRDTVTFSVGSLATAQSLQLQLPASADNGTSNSVSQMRTYWGLSQVQCDAVVAGTADFNTFTNMREWVGGAAVPETPAGIRVTEGATPLGICLREPVKYAAVSFRVYGQFQYRIPGSEFYFERTADNRAGIRTATDTSKMYDIATDDAYIDVKIHVPSIRYSGSSYNQIFFQISGVNTPTTIVDVFNARYAFNGDGSLTTTTPLDIIPGFIGTTGVPFTITRLQYIDMYLDKVSVERLYIQDPFFSAAVPLQVSSTPVLSPGTEDVSASDITISVSNGAQVHVFDRLQRTTLSTSTTIPGNLSTTSAPLALAVTALESGRLRSAVAKRTFYNKRASTWFTDPIYTLDNWNVKRTYSNWTHPAADSMIFAGPDSYELNYGVNIPDQFSNNQLTGDDGRFQRPWDVMELTWNNGTLDNVNVWMQTLMGIECANDLRMIIGFTTNDAAAYQIGIQMVRKRGAVAGHDSESSPYMHPIYVGQTRQADWSWKSKPQAVRLVRDNSGYAFRYLPVRWGRRAGDGAVRLQIVDWFSGLDIYDSGWVVLAAGAARPYIRVETRRAWTGGQPCLYVNPIDGHFSINDVQLANLFAVADPTAFPAPAFGPAQQGGSPAYANFPMSGAQEGSSIVINTTGYDSVRPMMDVYGFYDQSSLGSEAAATGDLPSPTTIRARAWKQFQGSPQNAFGYNGLAFYNRSTRNTTTATRSTSEFVRLAAVRRGEVEIWADVSSVYGQTYMLRFDDGTEYPFTFDTRSVRKAFTPGTHSVTMVGARNRTAVEATPYTFEVPNDGLLSTTVPATVAVDTPVSFQAAAVGGAADWSYTWTFSDGQVSKISAPVVSFMTPGRYTWQVVADDGAGNKLLESGEFIVPYQTELPSALFPKTETRLS